MKILLLKKLFFSLFLFAFFILSEVAHAQCAICKASVQSADGDVLESGFNSGILYLMIIPYLAIGGIAFFWYRTAKKKNLNFKPQKTKQPKQHEIYIQSIFCTILFFFFFSFLCDCAGKLPCKWYACY